MNASIRPRGVAALERSVQRLSAMTHRPRGDGWYRVVRNDAGDGPTRVDIYDEIGGGGWFWGGVSAEDFVAELAGIDGDIEVHINSPGGDVFEGLAIFNSLAQRPGNVTTVVDGLAASAASFIAMAGKTRLVCPGAMMMIHEASSVCMGDAAEMRETADLLDKVSGNIAGIYADRSGRADGWRDAMQAETWYTADEAVAAGLAHKLAQRPEEAALGARAAFDLSAFAHVPAQLRAAAQPHSPMTGTHSHPHPAYGSQGGDASHDHEHTHDGDASHSHGHGTSDHGERLVAEDGGHPYEPAPYHRDPDETVKCPVCGKYDDTDARYCDQCGTKLVGRDDVTETEDAAAAAVVAGAGATTVTAKALPVHHTATVEKPWDGPAAVAAMPTDDTVLEYCHAWQSDEAAATPHKDGDDDADDQKASYKFPHHETKGGPANLNGCRDGLARLDGADIPDKDRPGVKAHLQAHLDDAKSDDEAAHDHAGLPGWLHNDAAPVPAWLTAKEATQ